MAVAVDKCFNLYINILDFNDSKMSKGNTSKTKNMEKFNLNPNNIQFIVWIFMDYLFKLKFHFWKSDNYFLDTSSRRVEVILSRFLEYRVLLSMLGPRSMWRGDAEERVPANSSGAGR